MVGFGELYIAAFAIAIGLGQVTAGLVTSLPILCGGISQFMALRSMRPGSSYRFAILFYSTLQCLSFIPLIIAAVVGSIPAWLFYLTASVYWGGGMASGPGWNAWMSQIVPVRIRPHYFAKRSRMIQLATLISFLGGGAALESLTNFNLRLVGFIILFVLAFIARTISIYYLAIHKTTSTMDHSNSDGVSQFKAWSVLKRSSRRTIILLMLLTGSIQMSGPYFGPYMLVQLKFQYPEFVAVVAAAFLARIMTLSLWGRYAKRVGSQRLLWTCALSIIPLAPLWILSTSFWWLIVVQVLAGAAWAGFELAILLVFFDMVPLSRRVQIMSVYSLGNSVAWFIGAALGGCVVRNLGEDMHAYHVVFAMSSLFRIGCFLWAYPNLKPPKISRAHESDDIEAEVTGFRSEVDPAIETRAPIITSVEDLEKHD
jgi:MFS family permease